MITWSLSLTGNQIAVLKALKPRQFGKPHEYQNDVSHWITGVRGLLKEGLLEHFNPPEGIDKYDMTKRGQFLTERGRFILRMIEEDIEKFLRPPAPAPKPKPVKRGKAA